MADDKVVIGSNEGTPVKPGDLTKVTSVINVEDDATATATIPRMKSKINTMTDSVETSNINRKEIKAKLEEDKPKKKTNVKLKPVVVAETAEAVAVPSQASAAPRVANVPAPMPSQSTAVPRIPSEDETVKIHKPRAVVASASVSNAGQANEGENAEPPRAPRPAVAASTAAVPGVRPATEDETVKIQKPPTAVASAAVPGVKQTIKLRPSSTTPAPISESDSRGGFTPPPPSPAAPQEPAMAGASEAKRTIRLVPKKSDATSGGDQSASGVRPSAPTIKLEESSPAQSSRSASTIKLPSVGEAGASAETTSPAKRTLKLKSTRPPEATTVTPRPVPVVPSPFPPAPMPTVSVPMPVPPPPSPPPAVAAATDPEITASSAREESDIPPVMEKEVQYEGEAVPSATADVTEPSIIFTIAACIAFFAMAYFAWMLVGQYCNNYMDTKISVPGLSGKVK
ncbi:MAG: hypothetical protein NT118_10655 [Lentisphaerae bacterium]|nr:hypothetical protein [Lentisphaerota bacterium]